MSSPKKILVTAATGAQGTGTVHHCLQAGHEVYALVRDTSSEKAKGLQQQGATLIKGDLDDPESLEVAMRGMNAVFLNLPAQAGAQAAKNVITAARASPTVSVMIASSVVRAGQHETFPRWGPEWSMYNYWLTKDDVEKYVRNAGFKYWTIVRPARFLQNFLPPNRNIYYPGFEKDSTFRVAFTPEAKIAWIDARDVGVVAAAAVSQPQKYTGRHIDLAAESLTIQEYANKIGDFMSMTIKVHYYTDEEIAAMPSTIMADAQIWTCEVPSDDAAEASKEFNLTSVEKFLQENENLLK
ncbi:uncharacterized protein BP5553_02657 [Venustampulla echinocandica]|uniref:NmrA-like domain-containing protein n=1 Tax=Venustampulla echinocandica TaxID=2656787 RepID=A0A370TS04_9HELO|nr:uncharacterized protein BP5553_02657 [Venustampulla echinocandica]RDL38317.1 hypothetical protein BP5553_02657 [Venustampulla echinocandica]